MAFRGGPPSAAALADKRAVPREFHFRFGFGGGDEQQQGAGFNAEDIFSDLLGGLGGRGRRNQPRKGESYEFTMTVSFEDAARGSTRRIVLPDGRDLDVKIPVGLKDGQQIRLRGQGAPGLNGGPGGDVLLTITVAPHPYFTRDGDNLRMELPVTLQEAVLGGKVPVPTLTGTVEMNVPLQFQHRRDLAPERQRHPRPRLLQRRRTGRRPLCEAGRHAAGQGGRSAEGFRDEVGPEIRSQSEVEVMATINLNAVTRKKALLERFAQRLDFR